MKGLKQSITNLLIERTNPFDYTILVVFAFNPL